MRKFLSLDTPRSRKISDEIEKIDYELIFYTEDLGVQDSPHSIQREVASLKSQISMYENIISHLKQQQEFFLATKNNSIKSKK